MKLKFDPNQQPVQAITVTSTSATASDYLNTSTGEYLTPV